jgi:hypothetical protein
MSPPSTKHPFDEWFERSGLERRSLEECEHALAVWNAVVGAAMTGALHMRDAFVLAGEYEDGAMARDIAEMIGTSALPAKPLPGTPPPRFPPKPSYPAKWPSSGPTAT